VAKSLAFVAYAGEKWMEIKNPQNHAAVKSFRENSSKGMLKGRHNAREFHDYLFAFEKGAEHGCLQSKHDFDVLKDDYQRIEEELTKLRAALDESIKVIEFYGSLEAQIAPIYTPTGKPGADFTKPYRMDEGKIAREFLSKHKELIKGGV
jgi:hypothetical protein